MEYRLHSKTVFDTRHSVKESGDTPIDTPIRREYIMSSVAELYEEAIAMGLARWVPKGLDVKQLREEREELSGRIRLIDRLLTAADAEGMGGGKRRRKGNTRLDQIRAVLIEEGQPLASSVIYERLQQKDSSLRWNQPSAAFRASLRGQDEGPDAVISFGRGQYGLRKWRESESEKS